MKPTKLKLMIGTLIILFLLSTSAWADGRGRGGRHNGGHGYHKLYGHHYKNHGRHYRHHYKGRYQDKHHHRGPRYHKPYRHFHSHHPGYGYGLHFSIFDPHFSFGLSTGGYR